jgi:putative ABC transport system permease protein
MSRDTRRLTGMGAVATLALAVLVFGCVLAATAGPREALNTRTQALRQTLATMPSPGQTLTVSATWSQFIDDTDGAQSTISDGDLSDLAGQFHQDFNAGVVRLTPVSSDWASITTDDQNVKGLLTGSDGDAVRMEISYRLPLTGYGRVLAGSLTTPVPRTNRGTPAGFYPAINVAVTQQTAQRFHLEVGSAVPTAGPQLASTGAASTITLKVAAILAETKANSSFWQSDPTMAVPDLNVPLQGSPYWVSGVFALPDESVPFQQDYGSKLLNVQWVLPMNFDALRGDQAQTLNAALQKLVTQVPTITGSLGAVASALTVGTGLQPTLSAFVDTADAVDVLLWLLYVSLAVTAIVVLLLATRMIVMRRATELALDRARGASLLQIGLATGRGAAISCLPAAVLAGLVAVLLIPGQAPPGGWWPGIATVVVAVAAPAVLAAWQQRLPRSGRGRASGGYARPGQTGLSQPSLGYGALGYGRRGRRRFRGGLRLVCEVTAVLAAIAGIIVFRQEGAQAGSGVNLYTSAAPALVAVPAVIIVLRVYPVILRVLLRGVARGRGATGFLGLAQAARTALTPALPAFALVLAITVAGFAGMVRDAVTRGEINASWQAAGADVVISNVGPAGAIPAAAQAAFAAAPGVQHAAVVSEWTLIAPDGAPLTALAVDPASYSALVASGQTWPAVNPGLLTGDGVLASPQALAEFGSGGRTVTLTTDDGTPPIRVRVAGTLSGTPALTTGGAFVLMPESLVAHEPYVVPNLMLLNGPGIDTGRLGPLVSRMAPGAGTTVRSEMLDQLTSTPVQRGAFLLFALALVVAAGLGLAVMLLQLALGAADREATLARLATMGLGGGQRARLVLLEVLPAFLAAVVAAVACVLVLPRIVAPAIDLSVFTGSSASVPLVPDAASLVLPIAGVIVVAAVALAIEIRARRGVVATLRGGE